MLEEQVRADFAARLHSEVEEKMGELDFDDQIRADAALAEVMLGYLEEAGIVDEHELCPHEDQAGSRRCRVTAFALPDDSTRLELFSARYVPASQPTSIQKSELGQLTGWPARFFEYAVKGEHGRFKDGPAAAAARRISNELRRIESVRINVLTNGSVKAHAVEGFPPISGRRIEFEVWDFDRLQRATNELVTREHIEIDFKKLHGRPLSCLELKPPAPDYQTFLVVLPGELLCRLYEDYGARLFEFNVRSFLQARGQVNKGIRETIRQQPDRFLAYNNGLTATADQIDAGSHGAETVIHRLKGLQIVNGAQTTASIHWAWKMDKLDVSRVAVAMKLTQVSSDKLHEFIPSIARYANTQNPVQIADLSANSKIHVKLEHLSDQTWCPGEVTRWFYERARGAYQVARARQGTTPAKRREFDKACPKSQHFGKTDLAKYWMSWWERPQIVSKGAQKNFGAFMAALRDQHESDWEPDVEFYHQTIALALLFKAAQASVRRAKLQSYGANVVTYMIAKLAAIYGRQVNLEVIWKAQTISPELVAVFDHWGPQIHKAITASAGSRNVTEWCKKDGCWDAIAALTLDLSDEIPPEITISEPSPAGPSSQSLDPVELCCSIEKAQWTRIMAWATDSRDVDPYDVKVANTIVGYALNNWEQRPSEKQARRGLRLIQSAIHAGVLRGLDPHRLGFEEPVAR